MLRDFNNDNSLYRNQPGMVLMMKAKPGFGDALFELIRSRYHSGDPDVPVDWVLSRPNDEPDILWAFEFFKDEESFLSYSTNLGNDKGMKQAFELLANAPMRADVHIVVSNNAPDDNTRAAKKSTMYKDQPGVVLRLQAKPGMGDALFEITTNLHYTGDQDDPVDWALCRLNDDEDTLWAFEFYKDEESYTRHYSNPVVDKAHLKVGELMSENMPLKADVHIVSHSAADGE